MNRRLMLMSRVNSLTNFSCPHTKSYRVHTPSLWITRGERSVRWRLVALNPVLSFLPALSHPYFFLPSHLLPVSHSTFLSDAVSSSHFISDVLTFSWSLVAFTQSFLCLTSSTSFRIWPSGQGGKIKLILHNTAFKGSDWDVLFVISLKINVTFTMKLQ